MEGTDKFCWFNQISDDVLLKILVYVPRKYWDNVCQVCERFRKVCYDKEIFRNSNFEGAFGLSEHSLLGYLRRGSRYIQKLNLNHCYWLHSSPVSACIARCKQIKELYLIDCKITIKCLSRILCSLEDLTTLVISVGNLLKFTEEINGNPTIQNAVKHLEHFAIHIWPGNNNRSSSDFLLNQQPTIFEYSPHLKTFSVIGTPGMNHHSLFHSQHPVLPLIVNVENMSNLQSMTINSTRDGTCRLHYFGILVKSFDLPEIRFKNLSISGIELAEAVKRSCVVRALKNSYPTLESLDLSRVNIEQFEDTITIEDAPYLKYLNLSEIRGSVGSKATCLGMIITSASRCANLVSINLKGATVSQHHWKKVCNIFRSPEHEVLKEDLHGLDTLLEKCPHLQHLNVSGVHIHCEETEMSLVDILVRHDISGFKSLALPICCLVNAKKEPVTKGPAYVRKGFGKRQRISRIPQPSTSGDGESVINTELSTLCEACPRLESLELIDMGFNKSIVRSTKQQSVDIIYCPLCVPSRSFRDHHLSAVSRWSHLTYLQVTGVPCSSTAQPLLAIARGCVRLERLFIAYLGLGTNIQLFWDSLQHFKHLKDLRIEQSSLTLNERFFEGCLKCEGLERLVILCAYANVEIKALRTYVHNAHGLYVFQLFSDMLLKDCNKLTTDLQKRVEKTRPGFQIVVANIYEVRVSRVLECLPLIHLDEITDLTSKVATLPLHSPL